MDHHRLLRELGATDAARLQRIAPGRGFWGAGVRASTQTPPTPSGKRVVFVALEDGSSLVDLPIFDTSPETCAHTIFRSGLLLVRGTVEARGLRRTVVGDIVRCLDAVAVARRDHGPRAALDRLGHHTTATTPAAQTTTGPTSRVLSDGTAGAEFAARADLQPARQPLRRSAPSRAPITRKRRLIPGVAIVRRGRDGGVGLVAFCSVDHGGAV
ncbi:hypothetical protein [Streptomyces sp. NBC_00388]|uniref:hypothetical protein n=1 Tax=Streptomyces sp. NBC_00388 TaxID=2975735 RepID=UPI003FA72EA4